jgi:hypothetical protein
MSILSAILSWFLKKRITQIEYFKNNPFEAQNELLLKLLSDARHTEWGHKYDYGSIHDYKTFSERVPLQDYEDIKPYVDRLINGESNLLWPGEIRWFAKSSGTTSDRSKFIPVSDASLDDCHYKAGKDVLSLYCQNRPDTEIFSGKGLIMGGSHQVSEINTNAYFGDLSAVLLQNIPFYASFFRTPDLSLALIPDWEKKLDKIARATFSQNITNISGVPSWNLILLKKILEITGRNNILEVWPSLELFIHGGVSFVPYREQYEKLIPSPQMYYLETYNASEGFFGIQDEAGTNDMLLMLDYGIYYEFIPFDELEKEQPKAIPLEEVKTDVNYAMIISTNGGLWRYMIGDTIAFTSLSPFRIIISGRTKSFINAFGEEIIIDNAEKALETACKETRAIISEYTAAPVYLNDKQEAAHEYVMEFEKEPGDMNQFIAILDKELQNLNSDYEAKRTADLLLHRPKITSVPRGTFYNWMKSKGKIGGQNKVPRLFNERKYVDDILDFLNKQ